MHSTGLAGQLPHFTAHHSRGWRKTFPGWMKVKAVRYDEGVCSVAASHHGAAVRLLAAAVYLFLITPASTSVLQPRTHGALQAWEGRQQPLITQTHAHIRAHGHLSTSICVDGYTHMRTHTLTLTDVKTHTKPTHAAAHVSRWTHARVTRRLREANKLINCYLCRSVSVCLCVSVCVW